MIIKTIYTNNKNAYIKQDNDNNIIVSIPKKLKDNQKILSKIFEKIDIIKNKLTKKISNKIDFVGDDFVYIFGEKIYFNNVLTKENYRDILLEKIYIESVFLLDKYSKLINIKYNKITIKSLKSKWGSCSFDQNIVLNFLLVHIDKSFLEYVIIHEICHLKEKNHSKNFWKLVEGFSPCYKIIRKKLKKEIFVF